MVIKLLPTLLIAFAHIAATSIVLDRNVQPVPRAAAQPQVTQSPTEWSPTKTLKRRGVISDLAGDVSSVLGSLGSNIPSYVASGVPNFFQDFPTGDKVQSSLGLNDSQVAALPTQVLNIP